MSIVAIECGSCDKFVCCKATTVVQDNESFDDITVPASCPHCQSEDIFGTIDAGFKD